MKLVKIWVSLLGVRAAGARPVSDTVDHDETRLIRIKAEIAK